MQNQNIPIPKYAKLLHRLTLECAWWELEPGASWTEQSLWSCSPTITVCTLAEVPVAGVTDWLLQANASVILCSFSILCSSFSLACFALGPYLINEAKLFPNNILSNLFASPSEKCLEQTQVLGLISSSRRENTSYHSSCLSGSLGTRWKDTFGSLVLVFPQTHHWWPVIFSYILETVWTCVFE